MKAFLKCIFLVLVLVLVLSSEFISCVGQATVSMGKNYMQFLRAQKFLQMNGKSKNRKMNTYISEDVDEFDEYETDADSYMNESISGNMDNTTKSEYSSTDKVITTDKDMKGIEKEGTNLIGGQSCTVNENGVLDVSINSEDFFNLKKYNVQITPSSLLITEKLNDKENTIEEIAYENIKLPIETIEETRECWKIKTKEETILFCETTKKNRDRWITNILKALFCYNVNVLSVDQNSKTDLDKTISIPKESTVDQRMKNAII